MDYVGGLIVFCIFSGLWLRVQESLTLESRSKSIPFPKAKNAPKTAAKGKAKAKPKARNEPAEDEVEEELPAAPAAKRRAAKGKGK